MKATIVIDDKREEVVIYAKSECGWARSVRDFAATVDTELIGYDREGAVTKRMNERALRD